MATSRLLPTILCRVASHGARTAIIDGEGAVSYAALNTAAQGLSAQLAPHLLRRNGVQPTVAFLAPRDRSYVVSQWAAWHAGAIGVPLAENYPAAEYEYLLQDCGASVVVVHPRMAASLGDVAKGLGITMLQSGGGGGGARGGAPARPPPAVPGAAPRALDAPVPQLSSLPPSSAWLPSDDGAMLIYTSGTTGRPKGVLVTHGMLNAQVGALTSAWGWSERDHILSVLPLHNVHGVVAVLLSAMWSGAVCELLPRFDAAATWAALTRGPGAAPAASPGAPLTLFMAVPTVYAKLVELYDKQSPEAAAAWSAALRAPASPLRLMVSGSAALPESLARRWAEVSGHSLLERYGMSEFSMALSNPLAGPRKLNSVGRPLPGYEARIAPEEAGAPPDAAFAGPGELQIRGPGVFSLYWGRPEASAREFTPDGWFKTGDAVTRDEQGCYSIMGRLSADIIKSGGFKISALDIERVLLEHPSVAEVAVFGLPDPVYGERVAAVMVLRSGAQGDGSLAAPPGSAAAGDLPRELLEDSAPGAPAQGCLRDFATKFLPGYRMPSVLKCVAEIPRNAMGKVAKKALKAALFPQAQTQQ